MSNSAVKRFETYFASKSRSRSKSKSRRGNRVRNNPAAYAAATSGAVRSSKTRRRRLR